MEMVLDVYKQPYDKKFPVICMDKSPKQLIKETRQLPGQRFVKVTERRTKQVWANFIEYISKKYQHTEKIILLMDNLNTHKPGSLYEVFLPEKAKRLWDRFQFVYTPKHGSWLNMAEIELNVLNGQCLNRRIDKISTVIKECDAWQEHRNNKNARINWQFTAKDARIKLKRLYPSLQD